MRITGGGGNHRIRGKKLPVYGLLFIVYGYRVIRKNLTICVFFEPLRHKGHQEPQSQSVLRV
jgi:hypothetical protein